MKPLELPKNFERISENIYATNMENADKHPLSTFKKKLLKKSDEDVYQVVNGCIQELWEKNKVCKVLLLNPFSDITADDFCKSKKNDEKYSNHFTEGVLNSVTYRKMEFSRMKDVEVLANQLWEYLHIYDCIFIPSLTILSSQTGLSKNTLLGVLGTYFNDRSLHNRILFVVD